MCLETTEEGVFVLCFKMWKNKFLSLFVSLARTQLSVSKYLGVCALKELSNSEESYPQKYPG